MRSVFFSFVLLLCFSSYLYADNFFPSGDLIENRFYDTVAFGIGSVPDPGVCPNCINFNSNSISGSSSSLLYGASFFDEFVYFDTLYGLVRRPGVYDSVSLPPGATVDVVYFYQNMSDGEVYIESLNLFLSRYDRSRGDLRRVVNVEGDFEEVPFRVISWNYPRGGFVHRYEGLGIVNEASSGFFRLDSLQVISPIIFERWEAEVLNGRVLLRVYVRNITESYEEDILFEHGEYSLTRDFLPYEECMYEYVLDISDETDFGYAKISNPNTVRECAVVGENQESNIVGESAIIYGVRSLNGQSLNYVSSRVKPFVESFCIERIPYEIYSDVIKMDVVNNEGEVENPEVKDDFEQVLGLAVLPKTGIFYFPKYLVIGFSFLVVVSILWYYFLRKRRK